MSALEDIILSFSALPGIGRKSAARIVYHLLKSPKETSQNIASLLAGLHEKVRYCRVCGSFSDGEFCDVCLDENRDKSILCVVAEAQDVFKFLSLPEYCGLFHVLGGLISPLNGRGPDNLAISSLVERVREGNIREVILATNPTLEGDATALYIQKLLKGKNIEITRLAFGLPVGGDLEYADKKTLSRSLIGRLGF